MKKIKFHVNNHKAILTFKRPSKVRFSSLKWELIEKNIDEILEVLGKNLDKENELKDQIEETKNASKNNEDRNLYSR